MYGTEFLPFKRNVIEKQLKDGEYGVFWIYRDHTLCLLVDESDDMKSTLLELLEGQGEKGEFLKTENAQYFNRRTPDNNTPKFDAIKAYEIRKRRPLWAERH